MDSKYISTEVDQVSSQLHRATLNCEIVKKFHNFQSLRVTVSSSNQLLMSTYYLDFRSKSVLKLLVLALGIKLKLKL